MQCGKITDLKSARLAERGASGSGSILQVRFKAKSEGETRFGAAIISSSALSLGKSFPQNRMNPITVEQRLPTGDVNRDGDVDILDLILVARQLGKRGVLQLAGGC